MSTENKAFLYYPNGEIIPVSPKNKIQFTETEILDFLNCQLIQQVSFSVANDGRIIVVRRFQQFEQPNALATELSDHMVFGKALIFDKTIIPQNLYESH